MVQHAGQRRLEIKETYTEIRYEPEKWRKGENLPAAQGLIVAEGVPI